MDLNTTVNVATAAAVVVGLVFALLQLRQAERKRREAGAEQVLARFQDPALSEALDDLAAFKEPSSEATFGDPTFKAAALKVGFAGDALGVMVFYRTVPLHMLDNLMGRFIRLAWVKVKPFAEHKRRELGHNNYFEWFQWLAERLEEFPAPGKAEGAHVAHADWKP